jgi:hypothetical protein
VALKHIRLYEDYTQEIKAQTSETSHTWSEVRDAIQTKIPFTIIVFKNSESQQSALTTYFKEYDYIKQSAYMSHDEELKEYPSIFIVLNDDTEFKDNIPQIFEKFKIKSLILGKQGEEYADFYSSDGSSSPVGNEVISSNNPTEMENDEHFKIASTYYKFVDFTR